MKNIFLQRFAAIIIATVLIGSSCKKIVHPTKPTPGNYRLLSYSVNRTPGITQPITTDNYRFFYDGSNRVTQIIYSTNDSNNKWGNQNIYFTYSNDSIFKVYKSAVDPSLVFQYDTFVRNSQGLITTAITAGAVNNFTYYGRLLAKHSQTNRDTNYLGVFTGVAIKNEIVYTSNNSDFLRAYNDKKLTATFTGLTAPYDIVWDYYGTLGAPAAAVTHTGISGNSDVFNGYAGGAVTVYVKDGLNNFDTGSYSGGNSYALDFGVWPDQLNRIGDFLQIGSFTMYGTNIYQNTHIIKSVYSPVDSTNVTYAIDAESKITQFTAKVKSILNAKVDYVYNFQYETY